ncbi:acetyltransferase [bacterium Unc6]|nr:acetyltransferase [bacterium Unc6]
MCQKILSEKPTINSSAKIINSNLGVWTEISRDCVIEETIFGDFSYAMEGVSIIYSNIGKFCSIASYTRINPGNHPMYRVSQHHFTYRRRQYGFDVQDDADFFQARRLKICNIGNDVWIGHGAIIMPGVNIESGTVIGAGPVATKDVKAYEVAVGVPAKPIRKGFSDDVIEKLLKIKWWDWRYEDIKQRFKDFLDITSFIEKYENRSKDKSGKD